MTKHLATKRQRLTYVEWDYNNVDTCPDLSGLRHRAFIAGAGPTLDPEVVFLLKSPTRVESTRGNMQEGVHYNVIRRLCANAGIESYYATYLIKYEMNAGRKIYDTELRQALLYVREELSILNPRLVVLVGEDTHNLILPSYPYDQTRYKLLRGYIATYMTIPDVLLARRNENAFLDMQEDIHYLAEVLDVFREQEEQQPTNR